MRVEFCTLAAGYSGIFSKVVEIVEIIGRNEIWKKNYVKDYRKKLYQRKRNLLLQQTRDSTEIEGRSFPIGHKQRQ